MPPIKTEGLKLAPGTDSNGKQTTRTFRTHERNPSTLKCLIVDDIETNQRILQHLMGRCGMDTVACGSGEEAVKHCERDEFHLVLMDLHMPTMSGFEAGEKIIERRKEKAFPLIYAQTADETPNALKRTMEAGFDGHLCKPIRPHEIEKIVSQIQKICSSG